MHDNETVVEAFLSKTSSLCGLEASVLEWETQKDRKHKHKIRATSIDYFHNVENSLAQILRAWRSIFNVLFRAVVIPAPILQYNLVRNMTNLVIIQCTFI